MVSETSGIYSGSQDLELSADTYIDETDTESDSLFSLYSYNINETDLKKECKKDDDDDLETLLEFEPKYEEYDETGRRIYENACRKFGIVPSSIILKSLKHGNIIDLKHYGLGPYGAKALSISLCVMENHDDSCEDDENEMTHITLMTYDFQTPRPSIVVLTDRMQRTGTARVQFIHTHSTGEHQYLYFDFERHRFRSDRHILHSEDADRKCLHFRVNFKKLAICPPDDKYVIRESNLQKNTAAIDLVKTQCDDIAENKLGRPGAVAVSEILYNNRTVTKLDISGNDFTDMDARYITSSVESHTKLKSINLSHNRFGDKSAEDFERMIAENSSLEEVDLSWNEFRMTGAVRLAVGLAENIFLKRLNVSWNGFDDEGAVAFGQALEKNGVLQELDVTCNRIGPDGFLKLLNSFKKNTTLETLRIGKNNITDEAAALAVDLFMAIKELDLKLLDLSDVILNDRFERKLVELKEAEKEVEIVYGYVDSYGKCKLKAYDIVREALLVIQAYLDDHNMKLVDLFSKFDADGSMSVSHEEFKQGLKESGISLSEDQVDRLINYVDEDGDGEIEFSELVVQTQEKMKGN